MSTVCNCRQLKADARVVATHHVACGMWLPACGSGSCAHSAYDKCRLSSNAMHTHTHTTSFCGHSQNQNPNLSSKKAKRAPSRETCIDMIYYQSPYTIVEILFRFEVWGQRGGHPWWPTICLTYAQFFWISISAGISFIFFSSQFIRLEKLNYIILMSVIKCGSCTRIIR